MHMRGLPEAVTMTDLSAICVKLCQGEFGASGLPCHFSRQAQHVLESASCDL